MMISRYGPMLGSGESASLEARYTSAERHADPHHDAAEGHQRDEPDGGR